MSREYPARPIVGVGAIVLRPAADGVPAAVLLVRRGTPPSVGQWSLPGGAQELGETAEAGARRELREETGLVVGAMTLIGNADSIHRDPDGRVRYHYTIVDFCARWTGGAPVAGGDVTEACFTPHDALGALGLWAEAHRLIAAARRLLDV